jgi:hypothetical protein
MTVYVRSWPHLRPPWKLLRDIYRGEIMPRYWISLRSPFGAQPAISVPGRELASWRRKPTAINAEAILGIFRRSSDRAIFLGIPNQNGDVENMPDLKPVAAFAFASADAATAAREGALTRLAKHIGQDGLLTGFSVGQAVSAIRVEASALVLDARFIRIAAAAAGKAPDWMSSPAGRAVGWVAILIALGLVIAAMWHG